MTAQEALERWEIHGDGPHLPQIYREMGLTRLRILAAEEAKPSPPSAIDRMPIPRLNYNPLDRALGRETPPAPAAPAMTAPAPKTLRDRALTNPARLRTDDIVLQAGQVGQGRRINTQLLMHVQKRLDVDRRHAEDRAERRELAELRAHPVPAPLNEEALAERLVNLMGQRRETGHSVSHAPEAETPDSINEDKDLDKAA